LHGITREVLARDGQAPATVLAEFTEAIGGRRVFADSTLDADWLSVLARATGSAVRDRVEHAVLLLDEIGASAQDVEAARYFVDRQCPDRHRAGPDALWLWSLLDRLQHSVLTRLRQAA
jgi:hypothetical protein